MARQSRIEYPGAIYHAMSRGSGRRAIFRDDADRRKLLEYLEDSVVRYGWEVFSFVLMPNRFHLFFRTPRPNLSRGMQRLLSSYTNTFARRHRRTGDLFQGRFKGALIEDESYFWAVSRHIHLNPVRGKRPLVIHPRDFEWSSYPGYADKRKRLSWVAYDVVLNAKPSGMGGTDPAVGYRRYVQQGIQSSPENPFDKAAHGWLLGDKPFVDRIRRKIKSRRIDDEIRRARTLQSIEIESVFEAVSKYYKVERKIFSMSGNGHIARAAAAWLCRRLTTATLRELSVPLGLGRPESVSNLTCRMERQLEKHPKMKKHLARIESRLVKQSKHKA